MSELKLSAIAQALKTARDERWTDDEINTWIRATFVGPEATVVDDGEDLSEVMVKVILEELASQGEDWVLVLSPLGDSVGWRAAVLAGEVQAQLGAGSDPSWSKAISLAVARTRSTMDRLAEEAAGMDAREQ